MEQVPAVVFYMRSPDCPVCLRHVRALVRLADELDRRGINRIIVVPGDAADAAAVQHKVGDRVTVVSSEGTAAHAAAGLGRTMFLQHSGTILVDGTGHTRYSKTSALPLNSFNERELLAALSQW